MTGNYPHMQGEVLTNYKNALHLRDDLMSLFILVRLKKSGLKKKVRCLSQHVALKKYGKS